MCFADWDSFCVVDLVEEGEGVVIEEWRTLT